MSPVFGNVSDNHGSKDSATDKLRATSGLQTSGLKVAHCWDGSGLAGKAAELAISLFPTARLACSSLVA